MPIDLRPYYRLGEFPEERFQESGRATIRKAPSQAKERLKASQSNGSKPVPSHRS